jgi:hypothetical protein
MGRTGLPEPDTNGHKHEVVKGAVMNRCFTSIGRFLHVCALVVLGAVAAEAAGIGVQLGVHGHNIPRALARAHNPHRDDGAGAQA